MHNHIFTVAGLAIPLPRRVAPLNTDARTYHRRSTYVAATSVALIKYLHANTHTSTAVPKTMAGLRVTDTPAALLLVEIRVPSSQFSYAINPPHFRIDLLNRLIRSERSRILFFRLNFMLVFRPWCVRGYFFVALRIEMFRIMQTF